VIVKKTQKVYRDDDSSSSSSSTSSSSSDSESTQSRKHHHHLAVGHLRGPHSVISSIKQHLPHIDHRHHHHHSHHSHHHHTPSHQSSSGLSSAEFDQSRFSERSSSHKPHAAASSTVIVERPVIVDPSFPSSSEKTYTVSEFPSSVVSETKIVKETTTVIPNEPTSTKSSRSSSNTFATSVSDKSTAKMGKYDSHYNEYEASGTFVDEHGSISDVPFRSKELPTYKSQTISSVHAPKATTFTIPCNAMIFTSSMSDDYK
jgi:hypothetical protein